MIDAPWLKDVPPQTWMAYSRWWRLPVQVWNRDLGGKAVKGKCGWGAGFDPRSFLYLIRPHPGISFLKCQREALKAHLDQRASASDGDEWLYELDVIGMVAVPRVEETDVEKLVRWNPEEKWMVDEEELIGCSDEDKRDSLAIREFLHGFVDRAGLCGFENFTELELFYHALTGYMRICLLTDRVAPLGFATLFAHPMVANWHERWRVANVKSFVRRKVWTTIMPSEKIIGYDYKANPQRMVSKWRIDVMANWSWRRIALRQEAQKASLMGEFGYIFNNRERLDKILPLLQEAHHRWSKEMEATPLAQALVDFKHVRISKSTGQIRRRNPLAGTHPNSVASRFKPGKAHSGAKPFERKSVVIPEPKLSQVPVIEQAVGDVRDPGGTDGNG